MHQAWQPLGWRCAWTSEIDPFACRVVEHHYGFANLGDVTRITKEMLVKRGKIDVLVGGSPCQSFSSLGKRRGMDDPRGKLAFRFLELAAYAEPKWIVWENVPRVLNSNRGRDFGAFLGKLAQLGYGFAYRVLDAAHFGLAQSRERVFVVGYRGDWRRAAAVLLEKESLFGASSTREGLQEDSAGTAGVHIARGIATTGSGRHQCIGFHANAQGCQITSHTRDIRIAATLTASQRAAVAYEVAGPLVLGVDGLNHSSSRESSHILQAGREHRGAVAVGNSVDGLAWWVVRLLMPRECERLMGFESDYTRVPCKRGKPAADTPRYRAIGNSMAVPIMSWLGKQIEKVEAMDGPEKGRLRERCN